jgi:hypothetical protein
MKRANDSLWSFIGTIFIDMISNLQVYKKYLQYLPLSLKIMKDEYQKNQEFFDFLIYEHRHTGLVHGMNVVFIVSKLLLAKQLILSISS